MWFPTLVSHFLSFCGIVNSCSRKTFSCLKRYTKKTSAVFSNNVYIFFEEYSSPFLEKIILKYSFYNAKIKWLYNADTYLFYDKKTELNPRKLPILSLEIVNLKSEIVFDITNHIEKIRYTSFLPPSLSEIIMTWIIDSGVVLDRNLYKARYIDDNGDEHLVDIDYTKDEHTD